MGIFNSLFGCSKGVKKEQKVLPWITLNTIEQLDVIESSSNTKTQVVFKHSIRCGVSRMVLNQFEDAYNFTEDDLDLYFLDLISYREVSNEVGYKFQVLHQSPQLLVIKNGVVVAHGSHNGVNAIDLSSFI
ncbi:bacillithiol system redox-active protein YtxJ [Flavobacteriaceae bacterium AH-315-B10]|nr:bacillithiol system redox-active protein YtxJ [Flavobacteriaceae bacterium AH-315-B10]